MKVAKDKLLEIIAEEVAAAMEGLADVQLQPAVKTLASAGIAQKPESVRKELMKLVVGLDPRDPEELQSLADMIAQLMDAAEENLQQGYGLEEGKK